MWEVEYYESRNNESPVETFIDKLDTKTKAKILWTIDLLRLEGNNLREPYTKHLQNGIFELRIKSPNNIIRILHFFQSGKKIILTNGFIKKTQKTPANEIEKAEKYKQDYIGRLKQYD